MAKIGSKLKQKKKLIIVFVLILILVTAAFAALHTSRKSKAASAGASEVRTETVKKRNITSELSSSGTISAKDTYNITSMAEGEVVTADFEEGDQVTEGQILYQIDVSSMESKLKSANNSLDRAKASYNTAVSDYNEAVSKYSGNTYKSTKTGYIKKLYIEAGDKVSSNTQIADIYNDNVMKMKVPFLSVEAAQIPAGSDVIVTLTDTLEQIPGVVASVSNMDETLTGGRMVRYVTVQVENPGGLTTAMAATATIGEFECSLEGTFEPAVDTVMAADIQGSVEVAALLVNEGDFVGNGAPIFSMTASTAEKLIKTYKDSMDNAESSLEQAESNLDSTQDNYDNYTLTAPISGTVIKKNAKVGDKVQNGNSAADLAVIYDLSAVTFEMSIDELDISNVKLGQKVEVTADAFDDKTFTGSVTNISLESSSSNGVTNYPVTVTLDEVGSLLPGMNVDGVIILDAALDVLAVPADSLMRGNTVYVKDETVKEASGPVPAGFKAVEVTTGVISTDYVEITSGDLKEGDEVYIAKSSSSNRNWQSGMGGMSGGGMPGGGQGGGPGGGGQGGGPRN